MSALALLQTIGQVERGTRLLVTEPFKAWYGGKQHELPFGTALEVTQRGCGTAIFAIADLGDRLLRVVIDVEHYHCVDRDERLR